jgi:DNA mismatch endonuclease Vsr
VRNRWTLYAQNVVAKTCDGYVEKILPELIVRRALFRMGYHYRLHCPKLPGKPDLVFAKQRKVVFVHGCFWHKHPPLSLQDCQAAKE